MANKTDLVTLDVGGKIYCILRCKLSRYMYFNTLLQSSSQACCKLKIDRDGEMFRHVLNFMRYDRLVLPEEFTDFTRLQKEAEDCGISDLSDAIREKIPQVIGLNVGGKVYGISDILGRYPDSVFGDISHIHNLFHKDKIGNYYTDHDGEVFQYVFNFLRSGNLGLPEGFDEFELLKKQAQFFSLKELEQLVKFEEMTRSRRIRTVGFVISGQVFRLRPEDVLREKTSDFAKSILKEDWQAPVDAQGNIIVEKAAEDANNLMHYVSHGSILKTMTSKEVERLKEDASRFGVSRTVLETHFKTMQFMRQDTKDFHLHVIHFLDHPMCNIAYVNKEPPEYFFGKALEIYKIQVGNDAVFVGKINIEELKRKDEILKRKDEELKSVKAADISSSLCRITRLEVTPVQLSSEPDQEMFDPPRHTVLGFLHRGDMTR